MRKRTKQVRVDPDVWGRVRLILDYPKGVKSDAEISRTLFNTSTLKVSELLNGKKKKKKFY